MCPNCKDILGRGYPKHQPANCPLLTSSYCGICASYGHTTGMCPDEKVLELRIPQFMEQLIPPSALMSYGITTITPLPDIKEKRHLPDPALEVYDTDRNIRAILMNYDKPISGKAKENRLRIQRLADELGRRLIYLKPVSSE